MNCIDCELAMKHGWHSSTQGICFFHKNKKLFGIPKLYWKLRIETILETVMETVIHSGCRWFRLWVEIILPRRSSRWSNVESEMSWQNRKSSFNRLLNYCFRMQLLTQQCKPTTSKPPESRSQIIEDIGERLFCRRAFKSEIRRCSELQRLEVLHLVVFGGHRRR